MVRTVHKKRQEQKSRSARTKRGDDKGGVKPILTRKVRQTVSAVRSRNVAMETVEDPAAMLAAIVTSSDDAIFSKTMDGTITSWNRGAQKLYGYSRSEMIGKPMSILLPPENSIELASILRKLRRGERVDHYETVRVKKNGERITVSVTVSPMKDKRGKISGASSIARNIGTQKRMSESLDYLVKASVVLAESLEYEKTIQTVARLLVPKLADWCTVHVEEENGDIKQLAIAHEDPKMLKLAEQLNKRYPPNYDAPQGLREMLRTGNSLLIPVITDEMLQQGARDEEHLRISRKLKLLSVMAVPLTVRGKHFGALSLFSSAKQGHYYTNKDLEFAQSLASRAALAIDSAKLFREAKSALAQVKALNEDLERRVVVRTQELERTREQDRANLRRLKAMLSHLPLAALMTDEQGNLLELNEEYCQMFHIAASVQEAMQLSSGELMERFRRALLHPEEHMRALNQMLVARKMRVGRDILIKGGRVIQSDYLPIHDGGLFRGQLFLYRDVTKERRIDASKSEFMSLASHQLRTPLTAIRWSFGRLQKNLSGHIGELEESILRDGVTAAGRMADTIDTMLQISRLQAGQVPVTSTKVPLSAFLRQMASAYDAERAQKEQELSIDCPEDLCVYTDPQLLREVVGNLLSNACKYTPEKGSVRLCGVQHGHKIHIDVHDSGYGIPQHQQQSVFKKFFRGDNIVSKDPNGTGLGLYLVSLIVRLLGGTISFESFEGRGTTFTVLLPAG